MGLIVIFYGSFFCCHPEGEGGSGVYVLVILAAFWFAWLFLDFILFIVFDISINYYVSHPEAANGCEKEG